MNDAKFYKLAHEVLDSGKEISDWAREFLNDMINKESHSGWLSINQKEKLEEIHSETMRDRPIYYDMACEIDSFGEDLTDWEKSFIADVIDKKQERYSKKQRDLIRKLYREKAKGNKKY